MDIGNLVTGGDVIAEMPFGDDAFVTIRYIDTPELKRITEAARPKGWNAKHQRETEADAAKMNKLLGERAVLGWRGITANGEDLPFSPENRDMLMTRVHEFSTWVGNTCLDVAALVEQEKENAVKNS